MRIDALGRPGKTDPEIACILGLSSKTVGKHVEHVLAKLDAPNRITALNRAAELLH